MGVRLFVLLPALVLILLGKTREVFTAPPLNSHLTAETWYTLHKTPNHPTRAVSPLHTLDNTILWLPGPQTPCWPLKVPSQHALSAYTEVFQCLALFHLNGPSLLLLLKCNAAP